MQILDCEIISKTVRASVPEFDPDRKLELEESKEEDEQMMAWKPIKTKADLVDKIFTVIDTSIGAPFRTLLLRLYFRILDKLGVTQQNLKQSQVRALKSAYRGAIERVEKFVLQDPANAMKRRFDPEYRYYETLLETDKNF